MDFLRSSVDNDFYPELDNDRFGFTSQHNKNSSIYPPLLDRPKSLDCLHRHTKSDNLTYEAGYGVSYKYNINNINEYIQCTPVIRTFSSTPYDVLITEFFRIFPLKVGYIFIMQSLCRFNKLQN